MHYINTIIIIILILLSIEIYTYANTFNCIVQLQALKSDKNDSF